MSQATKPLEIPHVSISLADGVDAAYQAVLDLCNEAFGWGLSSDEVQVRRLRPAAGGKQARNGPVFDASGVGDEGLNAWCSGARRSPMHACERAAPAAAALQLPPGPVCSL